MVATTQCHIRARIDAPQPRKRRTATGRMPCGGKRVPHVRQGFDATGTVDASRLVHVAHLGIVDDASVSPSARDSVPPERPTT
jgi:hypothetical protein